MNHKKQLADTANSKKGKGNTCAPTKSKNPDLHSGKESIQEKLIEKTPDDYLEYDNSPVLINHDSDNAYSTECEDMETDDHSDLDLKLHWSDDENDETIYPPMSDEALKLYEKERGVADAGKDTDQSNKAVSKLPRQDIELIVEKIEKNGNEDVEMADVNTRKVTDQIIKENVQKVNDQNFKITGHNKHVENSSDLIEFKMSESDITESGNQPCIDGALNHLDEELGNDNSEIPGNTSYEETVEEIKKFIEESFNNSRQNSKDTAVQQTNQIERPKALNITVEQEIGEQRMDLDSPSILKMSPIAAEINLISNNVELEVPIMTEEIKDITKPITMPTVSGSSISTETSLKNKTENATKTVENAKTVSIYTPTISNKNYVTAENDEFITPDFTDDSIKINTGHRVNRPDVMLHIPSQDFDFDVDFDETTETDMQSLSDSIDQDNSNMTATVTEIINQRAKNNLDSNKLLDKGTIKLKSILKKVSSDGNDSNTTPDKAKMSDKITVKKPLTVKFEETDKDDNEKNNKHTDNVTDKTVEKAVKALETNESVEKPLGEAKLQLATTKITNITLESVEEVHEDSDNLGLLAESSRVMDDEDQIEPGQDGDDADREDYEEDFEADGEESNYQSVAQYEASNLVHSELDILEEGIDIVEAEETRLVPDDKNEGLQTQGPMSNDDAAKETTTISGCDEVRHENCKSILTKLLSKDYQKSEPATSVQPPVKVNNRRLASSMNVLDFVDLEDSSSDDEIQNKESQDPSSSGDTQKLDGNVTSVPESTDNKTTDGAAETEATKLKKKTGAEVFNLDSDDDNKKGKLKADSNDKPPVNKCLNYNCKMSVLSPYQIADRMTVTYYGAARHRHREVCQSCVDAVNSNNESLISGIKDLRPLVSLPMTRPAPQLLEISDSDSEGEDVPVGEKEAKAMEENFTGVLTDTWTKYKMDERLKETKSFLDDELDKMQGKKREAAPSSKGVRCSNTPMRCSSRIKNRQRLSAEQSNELDEILKSCQDSTDKIRVEFYSGFETPRRELPPLILCDTPIASYTCMEGEEDAEETRQSNSRYPKRRSTTAVEKPAKKAALRSAVGKKVTRSSSGKAGQNQHDDDRDISVVRLSAESAPVDLPPVGEIVRTPVKVGAQVYAMKNQFGAWLRGRVAEVLGKTHDQYTQCRVRFEHNIKNPYKLLTARSVAYTEPCNVRMTIGTRVIALSRNYENTNTMDKFFYSGVIAEIPNPVNSYRYLVFFDDGYVQYVMHQHTRLVYESSALVWEEVHPYSRDFVCNYLLKYPERPMVRMHQGQELVVEWNGKWCDTVVLKVDAALVNVRFPCGREEAIYRGSTRLQPLFSEFQAARRGDRARLPRSTKGNTKSNMPYVEYTRSEEQMNKNEGRDSEELRRQRAVAKKSTALGLIPGIAMVPSETQVSRVVFYTPKNLVRPYKMVPHTCGPHCNRSDLIPLKELRTYNPLSKPLLSGWERQIVRHKYNRDIMYRAPCGRRLRNMHELHQYLRTVDSDLSVDLFDFGINTHCLTEFVLNKSNVQKKDLSHGKENVPIPCVNYYNHSLPEFCSYNTERTPTAGVPLNLDPEFLCGCDCEDDCADKKKCACWKMTLEGARTIGMTGPNIGYEYRRLPEPLPSGIYECNVRCKCKSTCLNRVVQNPLQLKLQVFKTMNRGWGIRALNDVPKGSFLCIYAGNLLTDATANLDGLNEGDEYLAELDYIEVVEAMKEGYEEDIPEKDKKFNKKELKKIKAETESDAEVFGSEEEPTADVDDKADDDFTPGYATIGVTEFNKRLRRRDKKKKVVKKPVKEDKKGKGPASDVKGASKKHVEDDCITISDDEEVRVSQREPSRFTAQEGMTDSKVVSKYRSIRSYFGKDEACYIMDAKVQGNIGRYLNHSCSPNVFVQNVFVDTHDPRFPWVSFFALHHIKSGTELTWNYNYDVGSVPGKVLYCFCGAPNCRGRLL